MADAPGAVTAIFKQFLARRIAGEDVDVAAFLEEHAQHRGELAELIEELAPATPTSRPGSAPDPAASVDVAGARPEDPAWERFLDQLRGRGATWRRYEASGEIARGGMGVIYRVFDQDARRHLAMKVMLGADDARTLGRFLEEAQVTSQLDHPGIVPVHEIGLDQQGRLYFTMKLVKGEDLKSVFDKVRAGDPEWTLQRALGAILRVCEAMSYAHAKGVIHRDLKPANVMVGRFGETYVMDWGLARVLGRKDSKDTRLAPTLGVSQSVVRSERGDAAARTPDSPLVTMDGDVVGTPSYMAPEQARGEVEQVGPQADVYAVGAMLYHLLSGAMPFLAHGASNVSPRTILARLLDGPPEPLGDLAESAPGELVAIVEKAMARPIAERYPNMLELADDLRAFLDQRVVKAYESGAFAELRKWMRRNRALAAALFLVLLVAIAGLGVVLGKNRALEQTNAKLEASRAEALAKAAEVQQLSDARAARDLAASAADLAATDAAALARMEEWLALADRLVERLPEHADALAALRARALPADPAARAEREGREALLGDLVASASRLAEDAIPAVRMRLARGRGLEQRSIADHRAAWDEAIRSIGDRADCPMYGGLQLKPQLGLVPIGRDPRSRLWEFWVVASGDRPARAADGSLALDAHSGLVLALVPGGTFWMGAQATDPKGLKYDAAAPLEEGPVHSVTLDPFLIGKYEMTESQWARAQGRLAPAVGALLPAAGVSWLEARSTLLALALDFPTEAQWEFACARAAATKDAAALGLAGPLAVGSLVPDALGLFDCQGNVSEWCRDEVGHYGDPVEPGTGERQVAARLGFRVHRGACFADTPAAARATARRPAPPMTSIPGVGIRPARDLAR